ncbi:hypothetical protein BDR07DRAFT_1388711 [Suillus spraguei]|nr:hypothetical protein BDR07DRAFT_1388711 [Suillus spraguei]
MCNAYKPPAVLQKLIGMHGLYYRLRLGQSVDSIRDKPFVTNDNGMLRKCLRYSNEITICTSTFYAIIVLIKFTGILPRNWLYVLQDGMEVTKAPHHQVISAVAYNFSQTRH